MPDACREAELRINSGIDRGGAVTIFVDGKPFEAFAGETVACALLAAGQRRLRSSPAGGSRGMFCAMGVCQECVVEIDGRSLASCQHPVSEGLRIVLRELTDDH